MRLIDADKLIPTCKFRGECRGGDCDKCSNNAVEWSDIEKAPSVTLNVGEWRDDGKCPFCKKGTATNLFYNNFCSCCGAQLFGYEDHIRK